MTKSLLIDVDSNGFPNLALMQLSNYLKNKGNEVYFGSMKENPDEIFISCVFEKNYFKAISVSNYYKDAKIYMGGTGIKKVNYPDFDFSHEKPDYSIYPNCDFSIGFTTRGCIRKCPWCVVPSKEGYIHLHSPINEFLNESFNKIILLDGNLLAYENHKDILRDLIKINKKVCFSQGLDIRLIDDENAKLLSKIKYYDFKFKLRRLYFAWDTIGIEKELENGINILSNNGIKNNRLMFYILIGYNTNYFQDIYRVNKLINLGIKPYVMVYNMKKGTYHYHLKRWIERRYYEIIPWIKYKSGNSQYWINKMENMKNIKNLKNYIDEDD